MNSISIKLALPRYSKYARKALSASSRRYCQECKNIKDPCNCPKPKKKPPYETIIEKSCEPCIFYTWKPKEIKLPIKYDSNMYNLKSGSVTKFTKCVPGMKGPITRCQAEEKAEVCKLRCDPKTLKPDCTEPPKPPRKPFPTCLEPDVPKADWEMPRGK